MIDKPHKKLDLWKRSLDLAALVYKTTYDFPREERFGLISQMRRSSISVISNIAEGAARNSKKEFIQFLFIAKGSLSELDAQCEIAKKLNFLNDNCYEELGTLMVSVDKMLTGLIKSLGK